MLSSLTLDEKNIMISYKGKNIINDIEVFVRIRDFELKELKLTNHTFLDNKYTLFFEDEEKITECKLEFGVCNDLLKIYAYINCRQELMISNRYIAPENGFIVRFNIPEKSDGVVATYMENAYWTLPFYSDDAKNLPNHTQNMLFKSGSEHISFLTKHLNNAIVELGATNKKTEIRCSTISAGFKQLEGEIMSICIEKTPSEAICKNYEYMGNKQKKAFPKMFNKLGWCSWNAFYHDVTEEKLFAKLEEFKRKDIPIKWILIDDGWSMTEDNKLLSFCEDKNKFPHGLGYFVQKAKSEYGIEYVGAWHAFTAYWEGIKKDSELYYLQKDRLFETNTGYILPTAEGAFGFFNDWYQYLKKQGIDFVKIDVQGGIKLLAEHSANVIKLTESYHKAIEACVEYNFGGICINCMGQSQENLQLRNVGCLVRNSNDFFPDDEESLINHAWQNACNNVFNSTLYYSDWDMWWTKHKTNVQSSVLRAISGGPVYISDRLEKTDEQILKPLYDVDKTIIRCDESAMPTYDCIYRSCKDNVLKIRNYSNKSPVIAVFNFNCEAVEVEISTLDICSNEEFIAYSYFNKKFMKFDKSIKLTINANMCDIINFYTVYEGCINVGDLSKYISVGTKSKKKVKLEEIL